MCFIVGDYVIVIKWVRGICLMYYVHALRPVVLGLGHIYIKQIPNAHVITNIYHFWHSKNQTAQLVYIVTDADFDGGRLF